MLACFWRQRLSVPRQGQRQKHTGLVGEGRGVGLSVCSRAVFRVDESRRLIVRVVAARAGTGLGLRIAGRREQAQSGGLPGFEEQGKAKNTTESSSAVNSARLSPQGGEPDAGRPRARKEQESCRARGGGARKSPSAGSALCLLWSGKLGQMLQQASPHLPRVLLDRVAAGERVRLLSTAAACTGGARGLRALPAAEQKRGPDRTDGVRVSAAENVFRCVHGESSIQICDDSQYALLAEVLLPRLWLLLHFRQ